MSCPPYPEISVRDAHATLDHYRVVDVRETHEFLGPLGFIGGAELVPLATLADAADELAGGRPLLLVCRSGKRSGTACETLEKCGVEDVTNLAGGMIAWNRAGLPAACSEPRCLAQLIEQIVRWIAQVGPLTVDAAEAVVRERFERLGFAPDAPSHAAVDELISFVEESMQVVDPPDLDLSLAAFRRFLAVL